MIVKPAAFARLLAARDPALAAILICGEDPMRVALRRHEAVAARIGPQGEAEMRLTRLPAAEVRRDGALLTDALRERGFFPGPRAVLLEDATDTLTEAVTAALRDWRPGDAQLIVTAGGLTGKSTLKRLFDTRPDLAGLTLYDDPPGREEIAAELARAGIGALAAGAAEELEALARLLEPGDFRQTLDKIALYKWQDAAPLTLTEIAALAPQTVETEVDAAVAAAADRRPADLARLLRRIEAQGVGAVTLAIAALRHFRTLQALAADSGGGAAQRLRWSDRETMQRQARAWRRDQLDRAVQLLLDTDLALRSSPRAPAFALIDRALMRLTMTPR
jgi:DNA polymerase-3 subunit delta